MDNKLYAERMKETYQKIYTDRYNFHPTLLQYETNKIKNNIKEMALEISDLKNMSVFNIGTGIETVIFHKLGAKRIYHCDISDIPVNKLKHLHKTDPKFHNLNSNQMDIVQDNFYIPEGIDLVYLQGVVHHFSDCKRGLDNIFSNLNKDARIYIRNYRSGTLIFFVADFIRKFVNYDCIKDFDKICREKFGDFPTNHANWPNNLYTSLYGLSFDHSFVPFLHLFDTKELDNYFESNGFLNLLPEIPPPYHKLSEYNHANFADSAQTHTSFVYIKKKNRSDKFYGKFPKHIDQLSGISYREKYIMRTVEMMKKVLPVLKTISAEEKIKLTLELFYIADAYRFIKFYLDGKHNIDNKKFELLSSAEGIHYLFQKELENY